MTLRLSNAFITKHENIHTKITPSDYKTTLGKALAHTVKITSSRIKSGVYYGKGKGQFWVDILYIQAIKHLRIKTTAWEGERKGDITQRYPHKFCTSRWHWQPSRTQLIISLVSVFCLSKAFSDQQKFSYQKRVSLLGGRLGLTLRHWSLPWPLLDPVNKWVNH